MSNKMEKSLTSKTFSRDISYKRKGIRTDPLANRFLRANRIQKERKKTRVNEINKRRRMPLSPLQDSNATVSESLMNVKAGNSHSKEMLQPHSNRKDLLMKWREEKKLKQKMDALNNTKKKTFLVGQVKYKPPAVFSEKSVINQTKKENRAIKQAPPKRITRTSARLAQKQEIARPKSPVIKISKKSKLPKQNEQKKTMKNTKKDTKSSESFTNGVQTRSQLLKNKKVNNMKLEDENQTVTMYDLAEKNNEKATEMKTVICVAENSPQRSLPDFEAMKNTISFGRGSTEGVSRTAQDVFKSDIAHPTTSETESFAPIDFKFTVPSGVNSFLHSASNFHFQPLSPKSADAFLFPTSASFFESPHAHASSTLKRDKKIEAATDVTLESTTTAISKSLQDIDSAVNSDDCSVSSSPHCQHMENSHVSDSVDELEGNDHDPSYFRNLLKTETLKLNNLSKKWDEISESETELNDEVLGQIRTVIGQAQLLIDQRFKQFSGLIDLSENKSAEKKATSSDLQGFWDMIYFQVEDVITKFGKLDQLRENKWLDETTHMKSKGKRIKSKKKAVQTNQPPKSKAGKNRLQEMRAAMKAKMAEQKAKMSLQSTSEGHSEDVAFFTVLTPVKRKTCSDDDTREVVLTPVRRSARKSSAYQVVSVVSTPSLHDDPIGSLRLTPDGTDTNRSDEEIATVDAISKPTSSVCAAAECSGGKMANKRRSRVIFANDPAVKHVNNSPDSKFFQTPISSSSSDNDDVNIDDTPVVGHSGVKKSLKSSKRSVNRKRSVTRSRVPTPYYSNRSTSRIKAKNETMETDSPIENVNKVNTAECSMNAAVTTPKNSSFKELATFSLNISHAQTSPTLHHESSPCDRLSPIDRFDNDSKPDSTTETEDIFSYKYLCATSSEEENSQKRQSANDQFESNSCPDEMSDDSLVMQEASSQDRGPRLSILNPEPKLWRTPKNLISCLSDLDTPSPSSCLTTPMPPKTTFFISPLEGGHNVTPYTPESPVFPGIEKAENKPVLVEVTPKITRTTEHQTNIACKMQSFNIQSPEKTINSRRDSVFSATPSNGDCGASDDEVPKNLIFFSPPVTHDAGNNKENQPRGSVKRFAAITPSKKMKGLLGTDCVLSPVRRSARLNMDDSTSISALQVSSVSELPPDLNFGYQPNPLLTNK